MSIPTWAPKRRVVKTTGTHVVIGIQPPAFFALPEAQFALTTEQYGRYCFWLARGGLIQDVFPEFSASEREVLQTGLSEADFDHFTKE
jgi:hypothetical protein